MTRYQHLANLLAERIEQGLYRHGEKLALGTQPEPGAWGQHQHRPAGVSDAGTAPADHAPATFRLFCRATKSAATRATDVASGTASGRNNPVGSGAGYAKGQRGQIDNPV